MAADGVVSKDELAADSYVTRSFTPMTGASLDSDDPVINNSGAVIDFYGHATRVRWGDQIEAQKLEAQHRFTTITRIDCW